jgi:PilZ domain
VSIAAPAERRKRCRIGVRWRILLSRNLSGEGATETTTENLSSDGFYCRSTIPIGAGELLFCRIYLPTADSGCGASHLECRVRVVRVEKIGAGDNYGLACLTEDYEVVGCSSLLESTSSSGALYAAAKKSEAQSRLTRN